MQSNMLAGRSLRALLLAGGVCLAVAAPAQAGPNHDRHGRTGTTHSSNTSAAMDDRELARAIERDLQNAEMVDLDNVRADVRNGTVTLTGEIDSMLARERALRIARMYADVDQVVDRMTLRSSVSRSDDQLKADVERVLQNHSTLDTPGIDVDVKQGAVTLTGSADTWRERRLANDLAGSVAGVRRVNNEIKVDRKGEARDDAAIRQDVERRIDRACDVCNDVDVSVSQGRVKLVGTVDSAADRREVLDAVWAPGVVEVNDDNLKIDLGEKSARRDDSLTDRDHRVRGRAPRDRDRVGERRASYRHDDVAIERELRDTFRDDPLFERNEPAVRVDNGVVYLTGTVDSERAKRRAGQIAEDLPGVDRVRNDLRVGRPGTRRQDAYSDRDDDLIQRRVEQALYDDPFFQRHQLTVDVNDGVVRLSGRVPSDRERAAAEDIALGVEGVRDVRNDLVVSSSSQ